MGMSVFPAFIYAYIHVPHECVKPMEAAPLGMELQVFVKCHVDVGNLYDSFAREANTPNK